MARNSLHLNSAAAALAFALALPTSAQTTLYSQNFENMGNVPVGGWGPQGLINQGWIFRNNSTPLGPVAWVSGCCWGGIINPLSGTGYLAAYQDSAAGDPAQYSAWAIVPQVQDQQAGDILILYTNSSDTYWWTSAHMEIRYAPNGGTNTGNTSTSLGDFTQLLQLISPMPNYNEGIYNGWTKWQITLPGPGRIALRQMGSESLYFGVEDLSVTRPGAPTGPMPENFEDLGDVCDEGPCRLVEAGWIFRDQGTYWQGPAWQPPYAVNEHRAHSGFSFIKSQKGSTFGGPGDGDGSINTWAILPDVSHAQGDELSFLVRGHLGTDGRFQVRYSPSGGTSTGTGGSGTGDFTQLLFELDVLSEYGWQEIRLTLPSAGGRIALRSYDPYEPFYDQPVVISIDSMALNAPPHDPPLPQPGQSVVWAAANSPIDLFTDLYVPPTGTVTIEPAVTVHIDPNSTLHIGGTVQGAGATGSNITIESAANYPPGIIVNGTLDLVHAVVNTQVQPGIHGSLLFDSCNFTGPNGLIFNQWAPIIHLTDTPPFIRITNSAFTNGADLYPSDAILRLTSTTFSSGSFAWMNRGYFFLDDLDFNGGGLSLGRDQQSVHLDSIRVQNAPGPAISVFGDNIGNDYYFGPNNVLTNNLHPVAATGGIVQGSVLPASGNINNSVLVDPGEVEIRGPVNWHDAGIPYEVSPANHLFLHAEVNMHQGVEFQFPPGIAIRQTFNFATYGEPQAPVRLRGRAGGGGLWWAVFTPWRMEYTHLEGSSGGVVNPASGLPGFFDACLFQNNARGMVGGCVVSKSQFLNNGVGIDNGWLMNGALVGHNPNSFVGNGVAVMGGGDARNNWWGHPSGPTSPQNPGGQGDSVQGNAPVIPFRTQPPVSDAVNHPPVVRLERMYFVVKSGGDIIINWKTTDADVASHRVLMSTSWDIPSAYLVVADDLPASARSFALTAPSQNGEFYVRVEAIDSLGQVGWDRRVSYVDNISLDPELVLGPPAGQDHFTLGHGVPLDPNVNFFDEGWVLLDGQWVFESFGAAGVLPTVVTASNDAVRVCLVNTGGITFSPYFSVRLDERVGDAAPTVSLVSPQGGSYVGGTTVPIVWNAADDETIRAITIQASFDGGMTYHDVVRRLDGEQTSYQWKLPPLAQAIANVTIRVSVEDLRFQMSSAVSGAITLTPGNSGGKVGDITGDGVVNVNDMLAVINAWGACPAPPAACLADVTGDGMVNVNDLLMVISHWD